MFESNALSLMLESNALSLMFESNTLSLILRVMLRPYVGLFITDKEIKTLYIDVNVIKIIWNNFF